jgi:hypothetical protein
MVKDGMTRVVAICMIHLPFSSLISPAAFPGRRAALKRLSN